MSTGRSNKLACQIGEHLVCAELGKRGIIATPFSGNVPAFDILAADEECRTVPIQVKASRSDSWGSQATDWMEITLDEISKTQKYLGPKEILNPALIYVCVAIAPPLDEVEDKTSKDRFFILTKKELRDVCIKGYSSWMNKHGWQRPKNYESYDCRYLISDIKDYEDNWGIITEQLR